MRPVLVFDGKCGFCRIWIDYWKHLTGDAIEYAPSQEVGSQYPQIPPEEFRRSVQLVLPSGDVLSGAHAVFQTLAYNRSRQWPLGFYRGLPGFATLTEVGYRIVANHRDFFYWATVLLFGRKVQPLQFESVQWIFSKLLGLIWLVAFTSFAVQASGLIGSGGILPVQQWLARLSEHAGGAAWRIAPTLFWLNSSDTAIYSVCIAGVVCALCALSGVLWRPALLGAFLLYLSIVNASQEFLSFQWDILLLETGFLAIFSGYSGVVVWMFRWLLFRLMFLSGAVKLLSGDSTWRDLTALTVHYQTQPIPTPLAWYAHQLPVWFQRASCFAVLFVELVIPFLALGPRQLRRFAAPWLIGLQILILLTGNYAFFNLLTLVLCLFLFDDAALSRALPHAWLTRAARFQPGRIHAAIAWSAAAIIAVFSSAFVWHTMRRDPPETVRSLVSHAAPFGITSSYGLFANMTTTRLEIVLEGSNDGASWSAYEFKYKPGRLDRAPPWIAPHQPRLDWQMWFAALGSYRENIWLVNTVARLLQGTPDVLRLFEHNPFPQAPPKLIRGQLYAYHFTDWKAGHATGAWWTRTPAGTYLPAVSLNELSDLPLLK